MSFSYDFPLPSGLDAGKYGWVLAFGGSGGGIVMSQSRMLEIARVVQPREQLSYSSAPGLSFTTGSWVEMLVQYLYSNHPFI